MLNIGIAAFIAKHAISKFQIKVFSHLPFKIFTDNGRYQLADAARRRRTEVLHDISLEWEWRLHVENRACTLDNDKVQSTTVHTAI